MQIIDAVRAAEKTGSWSVIPHEPTSVLVGFVNKNTGCSDETELDLYAEDKVAELTDLWASLAHEMGSAPDLVTEVEAYGYIR